MMRAGESEAKKKAVFGRRIIQTLWHDPVWSKVIGGLILAALFCIGNWLIFSSPKAAKIDPKADKYSDEFAHFDTTDIEQAKDMGEVSLSKSDLPPPNIIPKSLLMDLESRGKALLENRDISADDYAVWRGSLIAAIQSSNAGDAKNIEEHMPSVGSEPINGERDKIREQNIIRGSIGYGLGLLGKLKAK